MQTPNRRIKVLIYDDQDLTRQGMVDFLKAEERFLITDIAKGSKLISIVEETRPDIIITCVQTSETDIAQFIRTVFTKYPTTCILTVSTFHHVHDVIRMLQAGANGCLLRNASRQELIKAINDVYTHGFYYSQQIVDKLAQLLTKREVAQFHLPFSVHLTEKEKRLIKYLCNGYSFKQIAAETGLSVYSLESTKRQLYYKLNITSVAGLINYAIVNGLHSPYGFSC